VIAEVVWDRRALTDRERKILRGHMATVGKLKDEGELDLRGLLLRNSKGDCLERILNLMDFWCMNKIYLQWQPGDCRYVRQGYGHWLSFQDRVLKEMFLFFIPM